MRQEKYCPAPVYVYVCHAQATLSRRGFEAGILLEEKKYFFSFDILDSV